MARWLKFLFYAVSALGLALITLPWWFGVALRPIARSKGMQFARYERVGYARFLLTDVRYVRNGLEVSATRLEAPTPLLWLVSRNSRFVATDWRVAMPERAASGALKPTSSMVDGMPALHRVISSTARSLRRWAPRVTLDRGLVAWPGQSLALLKVDWANSNLAVSELKWRGYAGDLVADLSSTSEIAAKLTLPAAPGEGALRWSGAQVQLTGSLWAQPLVARGRFPDKGWWPEEAEFTAENWKVPADRLKLGASYAEVSGQARLMWRDGRFDLVTGSSASPKPGTKSPPLELQVEAHGDRESMTVARLRLVSPFATATLTAPMRLVFADGFPSGPARLDLAADLSKQPWISPLSGKLRGRIAVDSRSRVEFTAELENVQRDDFAIESATAEGVLAWPRLEITRLRAKLDHSSQLTVAGSADLATRQLDAVTLQAKLASASISRWLPRNARWKDADISARLSGPWDAPTHGGEARIIQAQIAALKPTDLTVNWSGHARVVDQVDMQAVAGRSTLALAGSLDATHADIRELRFSPADGEPWQLASPATVAWSPDLRIENLQLRSASGHLSANLSGDRRRPALQVEAANVSSALARDWIELRGPDWSVQRLHADMHLDDDIVVLDAQVGGRVELKSTAANLSALMRADKDGVRLEQLRLLEGDRAVAEAAGFIALRWQPTKASPWDVRDDAPLELRVRVEPEAFPWSALADWAGISLDTPSADIRIAGTLSQPKGELNVSAKKATVSGNQFKGPLPDISDLTVSVRAARDQLTIESLAAKLDGHPLSASGRLPLGGDGWRELWNDPVQYAWRTGEGQIEISKMELASLARRLPTILAPHGELNARVDLRAGSHLTGHLTLSDAATRPLSVLGVVQDIDAELKLDGRTLEISSWSARLGGEPVVLKGTIALPLDRPPQLALALAGNNLPLVRRAGLLLRADLDLHADTDQADITRISGAVNIRDCLVLANLRALVPSGQRTAAQQPPYFSVEQAPFNQWPLSVDVRGRRAVRINTAVYKGVASPTLHLGGTLGEPHAVGEVTADEGRVYFPFATFAVQYGAVRLSEADPYHAQLALNAAARYHDYQLRLEGSGPIESPTLAFSSVPSLETAQVLLMVTSGQLPESEVDTRTGTQRLATLGTYLGQGLLQNSSGDPSRLEIASGERVSRQGKETYEFSYRLDDRWSLVGEYDEYDEYNLGVKWRAYTQEGDAKKSK